VQRREYKNAANMFTETDFTRPHREATSRSISSPGTIRPSTSLRWTAILTRDALVAVLDSGSGHV
jgi:hypothetical protein